MSEPRRVETTRTVTAAAQRFRQQVTRWKQRDSGPDDRERQRRAYSYWEDTPEVRFSGIWVGRAMSRARLIAARRGADGQLEELEEDHPAAQEVRGIAGGATGQSQLLDAFGPHLVVGGEGWVIVEPRGPDEPDEWNVVAVTETERVNRGGKEWLKANVNDREVWVPPSDANVDDPNAPLAIRIWTPHPARYARPDSPVMSSFAILDELRLLNAAVAAVAKSRLVGRGIVGLPAGAKLPTGDDLMEFLMEVAMTAYRDPDSAAATVPIMIELPKDAGELKRITFESDFDELAIKLREEAIRRFATASDTPAEVLLGQADINHWGVWAIKDEAIQVGVEPRLATVCDGLTKQWLWPALQDRVTQHEDFVVWYDTSTLRVRTNRSQTALELGAAGHLTGKAVRREAGFDEDDAPSAAQVRLNRLLEVIRTVPVLADRLTGEVLEALAEVEAEGDDASVGEEANEDVDLPVDETDAPPEVPPSPEEGPSDASEADVLAAAVDQVIERALERAGHRIVKARGRAARPSSPHAASAVHESEPVAEAEVDVLGLLDGAWERVPDLAARYDVDERCLVDTLDRYARGILVAGATHSHDAIPGLLREASCLHPTA